jgi:hypothetical protein
MVAGRSLSGLTAIHPAGAGSYSPTAAILPEKSENSKERALSNKKLPKDNRSLK